MIYIDEDMVLKLINWDQTFEAMEVKYYKKVILFIVIIDKKR